MNKRENILMGVGIILLVIAIAGVSYAVFSYTGAGSKLNTITTGIISMSYTESDNVISMDKALPTTDETGKLRIKDGEYFDFTVSSTIEGNAIINYEVAAESFSSNTFDGRNVKLYLTKINGTTEEEIMLPKLYMPRTTANTKTGRPEGMLSLTTGSMGASETIKYRLRMYVKEGYNPQDDNGNEVFQVRINIYGKVEQQKELTGTLIKTSGVTVNFDTGEATGFTGFRADEYRKNTTSIVTKDNNEIPSTAIASWDISEAGNGKAVAYIEDDGTGAGTYKLTLGGEEGLLANTDMSLYFAAFDKVTTLDLAYLDTSLVTNMTGMFAYLAVLSTLSLDNFDTPNVTNMSGMFYGSGALTSLNLNNFDTSSVTNMMVMFSGCRNLKTLLLNNFDTSKVTDMYKMFQYCTALPSLNLNSFDTSNVTTMMNMFHWCSALTELNISSFDTSNVTNMMSMFDQCKNLTALEVSNFDTSKVINMSWMFAYWSGSTSLDLTNFDTSNAVDMSNMFYNAADLTSVYVSNKWVISADMSVLNMFTGCGTDHVTYV